jgi:hypothetical protein
MAIQFAQLGFALLMLNTHLRQLWPVEDVLMIEIIIKKGRHRFLQFMVLAIL